MLKWFCFWSLRIILLYLHKEQVAFHGAGILHRHVSLVELNQETGIISSRFWYLISLKKKKRVVVVFVHKLIYFTLFQTNRSHLSLKVEINKMIKTQRDICSSASKNRRWVHPLHDLIFWVNQRKFILKVSQNDMKLWYIITDKIHSASDTEASYFCQMSEQWHISFTKSRSS